MNPADFDWTGHAIPTLHAPFTALVDGKRILVLPVSDEVAGCDVCVRHGTRAVCTDMPHCSSIDNGVLLAHGLTFMEDTPENRAEYTAALVTGKPMPGKYGGCP